MPAMPPAPIGGRAEKEHLGDELFSEVALMRPEFAGKITGMLLDSMDVQQLQGMLADEQQLRKRVGEALRVLEGSTALAIAPASRDAAFRTQLAKAKAAQSSLQGELRVAEQWAETAQSAWDEREKAWKVEAEELRSRAAIPVHGSTTQEDDVDKDEEDLEKMLAAALLGAEAARDSAAAAEARAEDARNSRKQAEVLRVAERQDVIIAGSHTETQATCKAKRVVAKAGQKKTAPGGRCQDVSADRRKADDLERRVAEAEVAALAESSGRAARVQAKADRNLATEHAVESTCQDLKGCQAQLNEINSSKAQADALAVAQRDVKVADEERFRAERRLREVQSELEQLRG